MRLERKLPNTRSKSAPAAGLVSGCPDEDPVGPTVEGDRVAQLWKLAPDPDQRLLHGVVSAVPIAKDERRDCVEPVYLLRRQLAERVLITPLCSLDESFSH